MPLVAPTMSRIKSINAQWAMISPPWVPTIVDPPQFEFVFDDFPPQDLIANIRTAKAAGLHVALRLEVFPTPFSPTQSTACLDALFQQMQSFSLHHPCGLQSGRSCKRGFGSGETERNRDCVGNRRLLAPYSNRGRDLRNRRVCRASRAWSVPSQFRNPKYIVRQ